MIKKAVGLAAEEAAARGQHHEQELCAPGARQCFHFGEQAGDEDFMLREVELARVAQELD